MVNTRRRKVLEMKVALAILSTYAALTLFKGISPQQAAMQVLICWLGVSIFASVVMLREYTCLTEYEVRELAPLRKLLFFPLKFPSRQTNYVVSILVRGVLNAGGIYLLMYGLSLLTPNPLVCLVGSCLIALSWEGASQFEKATLSPYCG